MRLVVSNSLNFNVNVFLGLMVICNTGIRSIKFLEDNDQPFDELKTEDEEEKANIFGVSAN